MKRRALTSTIPDVPYDDYPLLPTLTIQCPVHLGRKLIGTILSTVLLLLSLISTIVSIVYYSDPPPPIGGGYLNSLKEILCLILTTLLFLSRVYPGFNEVRILSLVVLNRQLISMGLAAVNTIAHFGTLLRWYVQEGEVYLSSSLERYVLPWQVQLVMICLLLSFILSFIVFCLMLLTQMGPRFRDLNPDLTAHMQARSAAQVVPIPAAGEGQGNEVLGEPTV